MVRSTRPEPDEVEQLLLNAQLRDELEPYLDDSLSVLCEKRLSTPSENEFLASMLAWERAPALPISQWFQPELSIPHPDSIDDVQLAKILQDTIDKLYERRILLDFTEHLSDRQLYCLIFRDILPSPEKKVDLPKNYLHWDCLDAGKDPESWLRYYANEEERQMWAESNQLELPTSEAPPYPRKLPRQAL